MVRALVVSIVLLQMVAGLAVADEYDAIINDPTRAFTKQKNSPESFFYARIRLDSKERIVSTIIKEGTVTEATQVVAGTFDAEKKTWQPGDAIEEGVRAEIFKNTGKVLRVLVSLGDDGTTIKRILVKDTDAKLEAAKGEFDAIYKGKGRTNYGGRIAVSYVRVELDDKGVAFNSFPAIVSSVTKETIVAMGKFNEEAKKWEAGEVLPKGVYDDLFADPGARTIYVRIKYRDDGRGIAQILVRQIGETEQ